MNPILFLRPSQKNYEHQKHFATRSHYLNEPRDKDAAAILLMNPKKYLRPRATKHLNTNIRVRPHNTSPQAIPVLNS